MLFQENQKSRATDRQTGRDRETGTERERERGGGEREGNIIDYNYSNFIFIRDAKRGIEEKWKKYKKYNEEGKKIKAKSDMILTDSKVGGQVKCYL